MVELDERYATVWFVRCWAEQGLEKKGGMPLKDLDAMDISAVFFAFFFHSCFHLFVSERNS